MADKHPEARFITNIMAISVFIASNLLFRGSFIFRETPRTA